MKSEEIITLAKKYYDRLSPEFEPIRLSEAQMSVVKEYDPIERQDWLQHACFMAQFIPCLFLQTKVEDYRLREKINRWLASLQTILWFTGVMSLEDAKRDNMNPGAIYTRDI